MAITGPIIPAKSTVPGAVPSASTTITDTLVTPTTTEIPDRAVQIGEIVTNVADGKLWLKKADETFAPLTRTKTLAIWNAAAVGSTAGTATAAWTTNGPTTDGALATVSGDTSLITCLLFSNLGANAYFLGVIPEGTLWSSLNLIVRFATASGTGSVEWGVSMQKPTTITDVTFGTETRLSTLGVTTTFTTATIPIVVPTGLTSGDTYRIKLRRTISSTNDTSTQSVRLLSAELRAV